MMDDNTLVAITRECYNIIVSQVPEVQQKVVLGLLVQLILGEDIHKLPESIREETLDGYFGGYKDFILANPFKIEDLGDDFIDG